MKLYVEDEGMIVRLTHHGVNRARFTIDYPCEDYYREIIHAALADILRPANRPKTTQKRRAKVTTPDPE